jgi:nucleotide-binding universal stress UspA family protein
MSPVGTSGLIVRFRRRRQLRQIKPPARDAATMQDRLRALRAGTGGGQSRKAFPAPGRGNRRGVLDVDQAAAARIRQAWRHLQQERAMYKRLLVPTDGSALSKKAARDAVELASSVGAELVALHVVPRYPVSLFEGVVSFSPEEVARVEKQWSEQGQAMVDEIGRAAEKAGVKATAVTVCSDMVAEAILAAARKHKCDLVVMASHGRKGLRRLLLGSETQHVLTSGATAVLVLR